MLPMSGQRLALAAWYLQYLLGRNMGSSTTQSGHSRGEKSLFLPEIWTHNYITLFAELSWLLSGFGRVEKHVSFLAKIPFSFINSVQSFFIHLIHYEVLHSTLQCLWLTITNEASMFQSGDNHSFMDTWASHPFQQCRPQVSANLLTFWVRWMEPYVYVPS
jgi:hypothetical protein